MANIHQRFARLNQAAFAALTLLVAAAVSAQTLNIPSPSDSTSGSSRAVVGMPNTSSAVMDLADQVSNLSAQVTNLGAGGSGSSSSGGAFPWVNTPLLGAVVSYTCVISGNPRVYWAPVTITSYSTPPSASAISAGLSSVGGTANSCSRTQSSPIYTAGVTPQGGLVVKKYDYWGGSATLTTGPVILESGDLVKSVDIGNNLRVFPLYSANSGMPVSLGFSFQSLFPNDFMAIVDVPAVYIATTTGPYGQTVISLAAYPPGGTKQYRFTSGSSNGGNVIYGGGGPVYAPKYIYPSTGTQVPASSLGGAQISGAPGYGALISTNAAAPYNTTGYFYALPLPP